MREIGPKTARDRTKTVPGLIKALGLMAGASALFGCDTNDFPKRFHHESYSDCERIERVLSRDYKETAETRIANGNNVFFYLDNAGLPPVYVGFQKWNTRLAPEIASEIRKGGSWGIDFGDMWCANLPIDLRFETLAKYNRYALERFRRTQRTRSPALPKADR